MTEDIVHETKCVPIRKNAFFRRDYMHHLVRNQRAGIARSCCNWKVDGCTLQQFVLRSCRNRLLTFPKCTLPRQTVAYLIFKPL